MRTRNFAVGFRYRIQLRPAHRSLPPVAGWGRIRQHLANTVARYVEMPRRLALGHAVPTGDADLPIKFHGIDLPALPRSEEHTSELQSLMRISYAVFCLKKKTLSQLFHSDIVT